MGICVHEAAAIKKLDAWMAEPVGPQVMVEYSKKIREGWWSEDYRASIGQPYLSTQDWPLHQVAMFAWVHSAICAGQVAQIEIGIGTEPGPDRVRDANSEAIADLPHPFEGHVSLTQKRGDSDGSLIWTEPVTAEVVTGKADNGTLITSELLIEPRGIPLEVGSTLASRTALHLIQDRGVARWPFGSDCLRVLVWAAEPLAFALARRRTPGSLRDEPLPHQEVP